MLKSRSEQALKVDNLCSVCVICKYDILCNIYIYYLRHRKLETKPKIMGKFLMSLKNNYIFVAHGEHAIRKYLFQFWKASRVNITERNERNRKLRIDII